MNMYMQSHSFSVNLSDAFTNQKNTNYINMLLLEDIKAVIIDTLQIDDKYFTLQPQREDDSFTVDVTLHDDVEDYLKEVFSAEHIANIQEKIDNLVEHLDEKIAKYELIRAIVAQKALNVIADNKPELYGKLLRDRIQSECGVQAKIEKTEQGVVVSFSFPKEADTAEEAQKQELQKQQATTFLQQQYREAARMIAELMVKEPEVDYILADLPVMLNIQQDSVNMEACTPSKPTPKVTEITQQQKSLIPDETPMLPMAAGGKR
jgi:hypothetical protein